VLAVGGSWMVPPALVEAGDWDAITRLCQQSVAASDR
jgi:2-dehydro-3-deoxyphosphogluconate aldolase/(4S)-4-hydroxy-2-oxoglutarate aldolase